MKKLLQKLFSKKNEYSIQNGFSVDTAHTDNDAETIVAEKKTVTAEIIEWFEVLTFAIIVVIVIFTFVFRVATIDGDSMKNTLIHGEKIIISNLNYDVKQGDIVVISRNVENSADSQNSHNTPIIKRVIATGGQTVNIDFEKSKVYVDGKELDEPYTSSPTHNRADVEFPLYVPEGYVFVMGDNRAKSLDSRYSVIGEGGLVDERYILGHAIFRIFPFERAGRLDNK